MTKQLSSLITSVIPQEHRWKLTLCAEWARIVGPLHDKMILERVDKDSILVNVIHASWAQELYLLSPLLKEKINAVLDEERIKEIRFKTVDFALRKKNKEMQSRPAPKVRQESTSFCEGLTVKERELVNKIRNEDLRSEMTEFLLRCKRTAKKRL